MQTADLKHLLDIAAETAKEASRQILKNTRDIRKIRVEAVRDVKIEVDYRLEDFILKKLLAKSSYPVFSEESGLTAGKEAGSVYRWIVDPLDGSLNFAQGIPMCCISIGLLKEMEPLLGVVYDFNRDEIFCGIAGGGAWLNGESIKVSRVAQRSKAVLCTGFPVSSDFSKGALMRFVEDIRSYRKVRLFGSAALSLAYVACGRADFYYENNIKIWDVAAGLALVKAAGGIISFMPTDIQDAFKVKASNKHLLSQKLKRSCRES